MGRKKLLRYFWMFENYCNVCEWNEKHPLIHCSNNLVTFHIGYPASHIYLLGDDILHVEPSDHSGAGAGATSLAPRTSAK